MSVNTKNGGLFFNTGLNLQGLKADSAKAKGILGGLTSSITFQSLFWWIIIWKTKALNGVKASIKFQSLFWWIIIWK